MKENKIVEVAISSHQIQGKYKEGEGDLDKDIVFKTLRVDPETSKLLERYNLEFSIEVQSYCLKKRKLKEKN